jgi:hypothetical protein
MNDLSTNLQSISIRGRVAYLLCLADSIFSEIQDGTDGRMQVKAGIDKCWEWLSGGSTISGGDIYYFLANENDTGLDVYSYEIDERESEYSAYVVVIYAIMYAARHAYNLDGQIYVPQDLEIIDETVIQDVFEHLDKLPNFDRNYAVSLKDILLKQFPFNPNNKFGDFIHKYEINA